MEQINLDENNEEKLNIKELRQTKKYPFLGSSPSLIDYFLIIGYDTASKNEIAFNLLEAQNQFNTLQKSKTVPVEREKEINNPFMAYQVDNKPVILNSIGSDFISAALDEELIIKCLFPNKIIINFEMTKNERTELPTKNMMLYLKANKIFEFDDAHNDKDEILKNDVMFNVFGYLFYEPFLITSKEQRTYRLYFPKVFVFISQYTTFKYFSFLSQNILFRMKHQTEIPLEIQIYNIVNFTPSPLSTNLTLKLMFNNDFFNLKKTYNEIDDELIKLKKNSDNSEYKNDDNIIFLNQFSAFPYLDINLVSIVNFYNIGTFLMMYIYSFLEIKCLFFSSNLSLLNNFMYVLNVLLYPFIDLSDSGQIYSISREELLDKNNFFQNNFIGVNCEYGVNIPLPEQYKDYVIINIKDYNFIEIATTQNKDNENKNEENKNIIMYYKGEVLGANDTIARNDISSLYNNIKKILGKDTSDFNDKKFLETKLCILNNHISQNFAKFYYNEDENTKRELFFKELNFSEKQDFKYKYCENEDHNIIIQRAFYSFNISIMKYFHDMIQLESCNKPNNELTDENLKAYYELKFKDKEDISITYEGKTTIFFNEEDKIFLRLMRKTKKLKNFLNDFIIENNCQEIKRPSLIMSEEFMYIDKSMKYDDTRDYFQIMNKFYSKEKRLSKINFNRFYKYYAEELSEKFYIYARESKVIKTVKKEDKTAKKDEKAFKYLFLTKDNVLDNDMIQRYSYFLNNLDPSLLNKKFPYLQFKESENNLEEINQNKFAEFLETNLLENKSFTIKEILTFIVLIIYIINLKRDKYLYHFFEELSKNIGEENSDLISNKCYLRKYIYLMLHILDEKVKEKIHQKKNYIEELLLYKEIMACIVLNKQKYNNLYYPNELLSDIIYNFNIYQNHYAYLLKRNPKMSEENEPIINKYKKFESDLLEEGCDYKVFIQNNTCYDKGAIKDDVLINITEAIEYKGSIQTTCKTCKFKIKPNLFFIHVPLDKSNSVGFYSLIYCYKTAIKILNKIDKGITEDEYFTLCANIIFYINSKKKGNNLLSKFIATSLG